LAQGAVSEARSSAAVVNRLSAGAVTYPCWSGSGLTFAQRAPDGAAADREQLGEGVVGAQAPPVEHGGQHPFGVGDLLHEDATAGTGEAFAAALSMPMALGAGGQNGHDSVAQGGEIGAREAGQGRLGEPVGKSRAAWFLPAA
jgi:hypothetical protein